MKYPDFPKIKVPAFLIEWNHNGLYFDQMNPCSYKYIGDGYTLVVFVGSETDPREFEISITDNDGNVGATCIASKRRRQSSTSRTSLNARTNGL